jgi:hypothetical protein
MRTRTAYVLAALTVLAGAAVLSGVRPLTVLGGLPLALVLPGAALSALLFRQPTRLVALERIMLIPLLSLATVVLGGLLVWAARAPLHRATWLALSAGVTLAGLAAVVVRGRHDPAVPAERSGSGPAAVRGRVRLPTTADPMLILPVFLDREGLFEPEPMDRRRRLLRQILPGALSVLLLAGAAWLSLATSVSSHHVTVTTLSVVPPAAADSSGERTVQVDATGLTGGTDAYQLVVTTAKGTGGTTMAVTADENGVWTSTLRLPADDRLTLGLYRAGATAALRTVIIATETTG